MAIILPSGFNITNNEPVDARFSLADQTARYGLSSANIYEGLVVYQRDDNTLWILVDTNEVSNANGWQQVTSSELSDTITDRLGSLELTSASHDDRLDQLEADSGSQSGRLDNIESFTSSIDSTIKTKLDFEGVISGSVQILGGSGILSSSNENFTDFSQSVDNRLDSAESALASGNDRLNNLEGFTSSIDTTIKTKLDFEGVISGSDQLTSSYDTRYVNATGNESIGGNKTFDNNVVISGDLSVAGTTTYTSTNNVNIGDNIIELNFGGSATTSGLLTKDATGGSTTSGSLLWDATNDYWKAGKLGSEAKILLSLGDGVVSGSNQITKTLQEVTTAGNTTNTSISITNSTASTSKTTGALIVTGGVGVSGAVNVGGDVVAYASSDIRLKNNILPIENPLQKINEIGGYSFEWNVEKQNIYNGKDYGVIAQEIEEILPELVDTRENGYKAVKYDRLVSLLIEGIKELSKEVSQLKEKIKE